MVGLTEQIRQLGTLIGLDIPIKMTGKIQKEGETGCRRRLFPRRCRATCSRPSSPRMAWWPKDCVWHDGERREVGLSGVWLPQTPTVPVPPNNLLDDPVIHRSITPIPVGRTRARKSTDSSERQTHVIVDRLGGVSATSLPTTRHVGRGHGWSFQQGVVVFVLVSNVYCWRFVRINEAYARFYAKARPP